jgi:hypothetical protein
MVLFNQSYGFLISPLRVALNEAAARMQRGYGSHATRLRLVLMFATISYTKKIGSKGGRVLYPFVAGRLRHTPRGVRVW